MVDGWSLHAPDGELLLRTGVAGRAARMGHRLTIAMTRWQATVTWDGDEPDWAICFQSRATPQQWVEPSTEAEIERAAHDKVAVLVVPIAFVSEHSETLVELDVEYRALADKLAVPGYFRVATQNADAGFIAALAGLVRRALGAGPGLGSHAGRGVRTCPAGSGDCPHVCLIRERAA